VGASAAIARAPPAARLAENKVIAAYRINVLLVLFFIFLLSVPNDHGTASNRHKSWSAAGRSNIGANLNCASDFARPTISKNLTRLVAWIWGGT
jgi:hypothetical protein